MKHDRSPALNRFENDLARAIDERAARSTVRRNARVLALASLVVLALAAGVTYAWLQSRDTSTEVATSGPDDSTMPTTSAGEESADLPAVLEQGSVDGRAWTLQVALNSEGATCLVLAWSPDVGGARSLCGPGDRLARSVASSVVAPIQLGNGTVIAGGAAPEVHMIFLLDGAGVPIGSAAPTANPLLPGSTHWAIDSIDGTPVTIRAVGRDDEELYRESVPSVSNADSPSRDATQEVERAANAGIIGVGTVDPDAFIDDPRGIKAQRDGLAAAYPEQVGHTSLVMQSITFTSPTEAEFVYDVLLAPPLDQQSLRGLVGHAVLVDDVWKVTRATACQVWGFGTGTCPPPE